MCKTFKANTLQKIECETLRDNATRLCDNATALCDNAIVLCDNVSVISAHGVENMQDLVIGVSDADKPFRFNTIYIKHKIDCLY